MDLANVDYEALVADLTPILSQGIEHLIVGSKTDVERFSAKITRQLVYAQLTGDQAMQDQLMDQLGLLAEVHSIRVRNESWDVFTIVVTTVFGAVAAAIKSAIK